MLIKEFDQWLLWRLENGRKVPINKWGDRSGSTHTEDFMSYREVDEAEQFGKVVCTGKAFCFTKQDPFIGIDLDNCLREDWSIKDWAKPIIDRFSHCYREISPSLTGMKIYGQGKKPAGMGSLVQIGDGAVEVYDHGRFFAFTHCPVWGGELENADVQEGVDWLYQEYFQRPVQRATSITPGLPVMGGNIETRAMHYINAAVAERVVKGGRNNKAFKLAGHLMAIDDNGERLTDDLVRQYIRLWNESLVEPLSDEELMRCVDNAARSGSPREAKQSKPAIHSFAEGVDLSKIIEHSTPKTTKGDPVYDGGIDPFDIDDRSWCPPGLIREIVDYNLATALYPQAELALGAAICLLGTLIGRRLESENGTRTNIYGIGVLGTGNGKDHARSINKQILWESGFSELSGAERIPSSAGLVNQIVEQPERLLQIDEIGRFLAVTGNTSSPHLYSVVSVLLQLFSSSDGHWIGDCYADLKRVPKINQPHLVLYGTTTPEVLWDSLSSRDVADGLLSRILLFEGRQCVARRPSMRKVLPESIKKQVQAIRNWTPPGSGDLWEQNPQPYFIDFQTLEAAERQWGHLLTISEKRLEEGTLASALWSRTAEKAAKLSLIFAVSRHVALGHSLEDVLINEDDVNLAVSIANRTTRRMLSGVEQFVADSQYEKRLKRAKQILRKAGKPVLGRELFNGMTHVCSGYKQAQETVQQLVDQGEVVMGNMTSARGDEVTGFALPEHANKLISQV